MAFFRKKIEGQGYVDGIISVKTGETAYLNILRAVKKRRGYGAKLLQKFEQAAKLRGASGVEAKLGNYFDTENQEALKRFYSKQGYSFRKDDDGTIIAYKNF